MKELAIIGAGIHGMSIYFNLPRDLKSKTIIIDSHPRPFTLFFKRCNSIQMDYLRSPGTHTLYDPPSDMLYKHATIYGNPNVDFEGSYFTPSLRIFKNFLETQVNNEKYLDYAYDEVTDMEFYVSQRGHWIISGKKETYEARYVILAVGSEFPYITEHLKIKSSLNQHVLSENFTLPKNSKREKIAIIGGGMSGAQLAIALSEKHEILLITAKKIYESRLDSDPGYIGKKYRDDFVNQEITQKIKTLQQARNPGSVTPYVYRKLQARYKENKIQIIPKVLHDFTKTVEGKYVLHFQEDKDIPVNRLIFATGLPPTREVIQTSNLLSTLVYKYQLKLAVNGSPLLEHDALQWYNNLFVTGKLAELTIGPFANNIIGAQFFSRMMKPLFESMV